MKYNPKRNERLACSPASRSIPTRTTTRSGTAGDLLYELQQTCREIAGLHARQPPAGSRRPGRAHRAARSRRLLSPTGASSGTQVLVPDTLMAPTRPRRTLPASRPSRSRATVARRRSISTTSGPSSTGRAVFMITNPNTLGLFEPQIGEIARCCTTPGPSCTRRRQHECDPRDRAPGRHGLRPDALQSAQDVLDRPHGGGGRVRGRSPSATIWSPLPAPSIVERDGERYFLDHDRPKTSARCGPSSAIPASSSGPTATSAARDPN